MAVKANLIKNCPVDTEDTERAEKICGPSTAALKGQTVRKPYEDRRSFMKTLCRKAGLPYFRFHALRHSGATQLAALNVAVRDIQEVLGHSNMKTTEGYLHSMKDGIKNAVKAFEDSRPDSRPRKKITSFSRQKSKLRKAEGF